MSTAPKLRYIQIADELREKIRCGELKVGDKLPTYAEMYRDHGATTATMRRVCDILEQDQLIERRHASGVYVAKPRKPLTNNVGFIGSAAHAYKTTQFSMAIMDGVQQGLDSRGQHLLYLGSDKSWDASGCGKMDGVLICNAGRMAEVQKVLPPDLPRVSLLTFVDGVTSIGIDDHRAARTAVNHLASFGHRRIACLMETWHPEVRRRTDGYKYALQDMGIDPDPAWMRLVNSDNASKALLPIRDVYGDWARSNMEAWLQDGWVATGCTAILVQNEVAGIAVVQTLMKAGIRVPEDVSVIAFDGTSLCDLVAPRLTTVALPLAEIGAKAVEVLNRQIEGGTDSEQTILLPVTLRDGESVAQVRPQ